MERKNTLINGNNLANWQTSKDAGGTPNNKNSKGQKIEDNNKKREDSVVISLPIERDNQKTTILSKNSKKTEKQNLFSSFLVALSIAASSGIFVLFLKKKIEKEC